MQLSHRNADRRDLKPVFDLYMDIEANRFLTFDPMTIAEFTPIFESMLSDKTLFVCELEEQQVATYRLIRKSHRQSHIWYLGGFAVRSSLKGRGIGYQILLQLKEQAKAHNVSRIELTVDTENTNAINLYRKVGFEIEGKLKNNYRLTSTGKFYDEFLMALLLQ